MTDILTTTAAAVAPTVDYFGNQLGEIVSDPLTAAATWINETFASFDHAILSFYHNIRSEPLDVFVQFFTKLGDGGIFLILLGLFLLLFKKSRKVGFGMILGIAIGALFTNILIKNQVARPRPYMISEEYRLWFSEVWHYKIESEFSFPSGHTTAAMATMTPVFLFLNKKKSWLAFLFVIALGASRNYIMVHFPSDIIGGLIIGGISGILSYLIIRAIWKKLEAKESPLVRFDIRDLGKNKKKAA